MAYDDLSCSQGHLVTCYLAVADPLHQPDYAGIKPRISASAQAWSGEVMACCIRHMAYSCLLCLSEKIFGGPAHALVVQESLDQYLIVLARDHPQSL